MMTWRMFEDHLYTFQTMCEADCALSFVPLDPDDQEITFTLPYVASSLTPLRWVGSKRIVVYINEAVWLLGPEGVQELGYWTPQNVYVRPQEAIVSPDSRWVLTVNAERDPTRYTVWDTRTGIPLIDEELNVYVQVRYMAAGFLFESGGTQASYHYASGRVTWLPEGRRGVNLTILADGSLLCYLQADDETGRARGIYVYDPDTDTDTPILTEMFPVDLIDLTE